MRHKRLQIIVAVGALLVVGLTVALFLQPHFWKRRDPPVAELPNAEDVAEMRARLRESHVGFSKTPEFVGPRDHVAEILRWLQPAEYEHDPPLLPINELGEIQITDKSGKIFRIRFFWAGHNPAVFALNGTEYFWGPVVMEKGRGVDGGIRLAKKV